MFAATRLRGMNLGIQMLTAVQDSTGTLQAFSSGTSRPVPCGICWKTSNGTPRGMSPLVCWIKRGRLLMTTEPESAFALSCIPA